MTEKWQPGIFAGYGVEIEYMIVDNGDLKVRPIADLILKEMTGSFSSDFENGAIDWSNELVTHVIELKNHQPINSLHDQFPRFFKNVQQINELLVKHNAMLLPGGCHPLMDPTRDTRIWPHEYNEIYSLYNKIFNCQGHGWSNLQSTHLNLAFKGDDEFGKLHAAIRVLLSIIPALSAASPLLEGKQTGYLDSRLEVYRHNQEKIPSLAGQVIPEAVFTKEDYHRLILSPIIRDIAPYDSEKILDKHFLNSRGAIARFDRGSIEIRIIDAQECPAGDLAVLSLVDAALKFLVKEYWTERTIQKQYTHQALAAIFLDVIREADLAVIRDVAYLELFGIHSKTIRAGELWMHIYDTVQSLVDPGVKEHCLHILKQGCLARRILKLLGNNFSQEEILTVYKKLADCLAHNRFLP